MRQRVFEVLFYLIDQWKRLGSVQKENGALLQELEDLGFQPIEIFAAFRWMQSLESLEKRLGENQPISTQSMRQFTPLECLRLDSECRGYLLFLEQAHVLDSQTRELVIERALAMDPDELTLERLKCLVLIVLMRQHNSNDPASWIEEFIMADDLSKCFH